MGHPQFPLVLSQGQSPDPSPGHPCSRQCLLKGCERWFLPRHFQDCYCSPNCRIAAQRWRRWRAAQIYRATAKGKQRRREQARRHRERKRLRSAPQRTSFIAPPQSSRSHPPTAADVPSSDRLTNRWDRSPKWSQFRSARRQRGWMACRGCDVVGAYAGVARHVAKSAESNRTRNLAWLSWERTGRPGVRAC